MIRKTVVNFLGYKPGIKLQQTELLFLLFYISVPRKLTVKGVLTLGFGYH